MLGIVIPAYKREDYLRQALQSLIGQTYKEFMVVVVDDHSPEPLLEVVKEFSDRLNLYYHYCEVNGGPGAARQIGLNTCYANNCEYVMFLDSDDLLYPQAVQRLVHEIVNTNCEVISAQIWQENGRGAGSIVDASNETWLHGKIYSTKYLQDNNIVFPPIRTNEDVTFNLIALQCAERKGYLKEPLYLFRCEQNSITRGNGASISVVSIDYISSLYYVAVYMMEKFGKVTNQIVIDVFACYNHYQIGKCAGIINEEINQQMKYLLSLPDVMAVFSDMETLESYIGVTNQYGFFKEQVYYFRQTFIDWLEEMQNHGNSSN
jgi:glycosyltransferase involved in cell wall biosynthesis